MKALLHGDWASAIHLQPLISVLIMASVLWLAYAWGVVVFGWPYPALTTSRREKWALGFAMTAAVLANWAYLMVRGV